MLKEVLIEAAISQSFSIAASSQNSVYLVKKDGRAARYLILRQLDVLDDIEKIHEAALSQLPEALASEPSFNKNCDLVLIHRLANLSEFKKIEGMALQYEEDPYHFKKYFLYFSEAEEKTIGAKTFKDFSDAIISMAEFEDYKRNPLKPSFYSLAARMFIKLPFLAVPRSTKILQTLSDNVSARLKEDGLDATFETILKSSNGFDAELIAQVLINEELENIKAANSGI